MIKNNFAEVRQLLKDGRSPMLPFERDILRLELARLGVEQGELGRLLGEAMDQSSETWHDNAPADAINHHSRVIANRAEKVIADLGSAVLLDYPDPSDRVATLGSIIGVVYPGETEAESLLLTGLCRTAPTIKEGAPFPADLEVITARSPLGEAVIGAQVGRTALYHANGRSLAVEIASIQQFDPQYLVES